MVTSSARGLKRTLCMPHPATPNRADLPISSGRESPGAMRAIIDGAGSATGPPRPTRDPMPGGPSLADVDRDLLRRRVALGRVRAEHAMLPLAREQQPLAG